MPKISYAKLTLSWKRITSGLVDDNSEPLIETRRRELEAALAEVMERQKRQDSLLAQAVANTRLLREAVARGKETEARLRAVLKGAYGAKSKQLMRFGMRPQRKRRRGAHGAEAEAEAPAKIAAATEPAAVEPAVSRKPRTSAAALRLVETAPGARRARDAARPKVRPAASRTEKKGPPRKPS